MTTNFVNPDGDEYTAPAHVELMFYVSSCPEQQYAIVHAAIECMFTHSVLMSWHCMEYMDDPAEISDCRDSMDWESEKVVLDHDNNDQLPMPRLHTVMVHDFGNYQLMVPYHNQYKFMICVLDQLEWADKFLPP
jgi:hypothetical protein